MIRDGKGPLILLWPPAYIMELELAGISYEMDIYEVKAAFATILHSDDFRRDMEDDPMNFHVELGEHETLRHDGTGKLTVTSRAIGNKLLGILSSMPSDVRQKIFRRIRLRDTRRRPPLWTLQTLQKVKYVDPDVDRERDAILYKMNVTWRINDLQFGQWLKKPTVGRKSTIAQGGIFAWEWSKNYTKIGVARLNIEYEHKLIRMTLGDPLVEHQAFSVVIKFSNIQCIWFGYEYAPCTFVSS